jgi:hypothetical protein
MDEPPSRRELAALYRDSERFARETDEWLARRKAERETLERENAEAEELERRDYEIERAATAVAETVPSSEEEPEPSYAFSDAQFDGIAFALNELHKEFDQRLERAQQRILQTVTRLILPGELAEREVHDLRARVIAAEEKIERQLKAAMTDDDNVIDLPAGFIGRRRDVA